MPPAGRARLRAFCADLAFDVLGSVFYAAGIYTFASAANFAPGGISGLALILNYLSGAPIGLLNLALNAPLVLLTARFLGRGFLLKSLKTMAVNTLFLDAVFPRLPVYQGNPLLAALFSGALIGAGMALIYMRGSSTGGTDFLVVAVKKFRPFLGLGQLTMAVDLVIILLGWPVFGDVDSVLYGAVASFASGIVTDRILYGVGAGKLLIVITRCAGDVARGIDAATGRGCTLLGAKGAYTGREMEVLLCACSRTEAYKVRAAAHAADPAAFIMITETTEVFGEGFQEHT